MVGEAGFTSPSFVVSELLLMMAVSNPNYAEGNSTLQLLKVIPNRSLAAESKAAADLSDASKLPLRI